ncbi:hypothetical protein [Psittacicella gerlachiana]|uniref:Glycosyl transferase family 6 n=1 Tax=Psittacicella gerlachiana TaxID=2028574 RepID=A0A3A1YHR3_9GAMM|nr:hypothetical protein [Psittacicella gerlachiana]RIY35567.1 hypothetical protein CKF59_03525 [Psittacicella gerlachiana]
MSRTKVAVLSVNTGAYASFFKVLFPYNYQNFLPDCEVTFFVFTDSKELAQLYAYNPQVKIIPLDYQPWPLPTLFRFKYFLELESTLAEFAYVFFMNANFYCKRPLYAQDLLFAPTGNWAQDLIVVEHFGQNCLPEELRSYERNPQSQAYISPTPEKATTYIAGAFNGGTSQAFLTMSRELAQRTLTDYQNNLIAVWHDESHLNRLLYDLDYQAHILPPHYVMPQEYDFESRYVGERQDWFAVLLNKNALPFDPQLARDNQQEFDPRHLELLVLQERQLENIWLTYRDTFYPNAIKNNSFNCFIWKIEP